MPVEIKVGPPSLTINQGSTFMVTDQRGEIDSDREHGVFAGDTRFVSYYRLYINGEAWELLSSAAVSGRSARLHLANPAITTDAGEIRRHDLGLQMIRSAGNGIHEDLDVTSYAPHTVKFRLEIVIRSDFADIFEVKQRRFVRRGRADTIWRPAEAELVTTYENRSFKRKFICRLDSPRFPAAYANGSLTFEVTLNPGETWHCCADYLPIQDERAPISGDGCEAQERRETRFDSLQKTWRASATALASANEDLYRVFKQSVEDMGALRLHDENAEETDSTPDIWLPGAGVPWFMTMFGRDSLIVSLQSMIVDPRLALGALDRLAQYQATEVDDWRDAEPGKMPHELRVGELAHLHQIPHTPYYGTADATILYLIALHEAWKWGGDVSLLRQYRDVALRCLEWIDQYGDRDGDGLQEYQTRSPVGYENMGWKDASDAVVYPDGSSVKQPKALCELQGYVFDAKLRMAEVFVALGEPERARELRHQAAELRDHFEEAFWSEDLGFYAFGLDPEKRPIRTISSNPGHLLWSGIVRPDRAAHVVDRLLEEDLWSGWGIRTLSSRNPAYNPFSYQLGSVWPHDNGITAMGCKRYGFAEQCNGIARDIFDAASCFEGYRLPELYAGLPRRPGAFPVQYLGANTPQAWAAGSVFQLVQAILGIRADAPAGRLYVHPTLPAWLPWVRLIGLRVGAARLTLRAWREQDRVRWEVEQQDGDIDVVEEPWSPWSIDALVKPEHSLSP